ncbi:MAG: hypothetical protein JNG90_01650 [Planctomycetaceae bacterium]|nr:hypothetical protein [Planctomycetaceae bacterium]
MRSVDRAARGVQLLGLFLLGLTATSLAAVSLVGCGFSSAPETAADEDEPPRLLSAYNVVAVHDGKIAPAPGVLEYDLTTPLFSDYTSKYRYVKLPPGTQATYHPEKAFAFPVGTIIAKTFAYPHDMRDPSQGERLLETRLFIHKPQGWIGLPYVWNEAQTEAELTLAGTTIPSKWIHTDGQERTNDYLVPDANQCKGCHKTDNKVQQPIGPKARYLNRDFVYADGVENQLAHWTRVGALAGAPPAADAPRAPVWNDPSTGDLDHRARAWLDINCGHCHSPEGPARNSGLDLTYLQEHLFRIGVFKPPVAAGRGSGGLSYDIVPGKPDESILAYRLAATAPDVMMPELGKRMVPAEAVALIREWIAAMPEDAGAKPRAAGAAGQ